MQAFLNPNKAISSINNQDLSGSLGPSHPDVPFYDPLFNNAQYFYSQNVI